MPVAPDNVIPFGKPVRAPSEPPEVPRQRVVAVVDSGAESVYAFDPGRGRFLGPAPRINIGHGTITLPGYPFVVSHNPPQGSDSNERGVAVAGGQDGTVVWLPYDARGGLGIVERVSLPVVSVTVPTRTGPRFTNNASPSGAPFIEKVVCLDSSTVIAISREPRQRTSVAYLVDVQRQSVLATRQVVGRDVDAVARFADSVVAVTADGAVVSIDRALNMRRLAHIDSHAFGAASFSGGVLISVASAVIVAGAVPQSTRSRLIQISADGRMTDFATADGEAGPVMVMGSRVVWVVNMHVEYFPLGQSPPTTYDVCGGVNGLSARGGLVYISCLSHDKLATLNLSAGTVEFFDAGVFVRSVSA